MTRCALARKVVKSGLSVRETEKLARKGDVGTGATKARPKAGTDEKDADTKALEGDLSAALDMRVTIQHDSNRETGRLMIQYDTLDQLDELCRIAVV